MQMGQNESLGGTKVSPEGQISIFAKKGKK